jgi:hypothetical protein
MCEGKSFWNGNMKPVTLVAMVVAKKNAVHPSSGSPVNMPKTTTNPETIPSKLMTT